MLPCRCPQNRFVGVGVGDVEGASEAGCLPIKKFVFVGRVLQRPSRFDQQGAWGRPRGSREGPSGPVLQGLYIALQWARGARHPGA